MKKRAEYPKGTTFGNYFKTPDGIRRQVTLPDGRRIQPRYPRHLYANKTEAEVDALLLRLNHREEAARRHAIETRTAFISNDLMESFRDMLKSAIPNEPDFRYHWTTVLQSYFLGFFIGRLRLYDPSTWHAQQEKWGASLLGNSENPEHNVFGARKMSVKTIKRTIQLANRFMAFLHQKQPAEYPLVVFDPVNLAALKDRAARLKSDAHEPLGRFVNDVDWSVIERALPPDIGPFIRLLYFYGLRRAESLGFESTDNVKVGHIIIKKQMKQLNVYSPVKDRDERLTPHWMTTADDAYTWIEQSLSLKMHPDTLSERWDAFMNTLKMPYKLHDLRRTFITRALRKCNARDVQLSVGHVSLATTMQYAQDDRDLSNEIFKPRAS